MGFLPARMSRLLVGGHKSLLEPVVSTLHAEGVLHIEDYKDPTGTTTIGSPLPGGAKASELIVHLRGLRKALGAESLVATAADGAPDATLHQAEAATKSSIAAVADARSALQALDAEESVLSPLSGLDAELSAVGTLRSVKVYLGTARSDPTARIQATGISNELQVAHSGSATAVLLVVAAKDAALAEKALGEAGFTAAAIPAGRTGTPANRLSAIAAERAALTQKLGEAESRLAALRAEWEPRLASAELALAMAVERTQAPLRFGVTETTFHIEGWVPANSAGDVRKALVARFGDKLYVEELGDGMDHGDHGHDHGAHDHGAHGHDHSHAPHGVATNGVAHAHDHGHAPDGGAKVHAAGLHSGPGAYDAQARTAKHGADLAQPGHAAPGTHAAGAGAHADDGHHGHDPKDEPPIALENKGAARPFEFLLGLLGKPRYREIDPTKLMLVFFPLFFGLMVGDVAVGLMIMAVGVYLKTNKVFGIGGPAVGRSIFMGGVMSAIVGLFVFGEALGIHFVVDQHAQDAGELSWENILGLHIPSEGFLHKTGAPHEAGAGAITTHAATSESAGLAGILAPHSDTHLSLGGIVNLGYYSKVHDTMALIVWAVLIGVLHIVIGLLVGLRNVYVMHGAKLAMLEKGAWLSLLVGGALAALMWGSGLGYVGLAIAVASVVMLCMGAAHVLGASAFWMGILEIPALFGNFLSYSRLAAIGASKAGMAIAFGNIAFVVIGGHDGHADTTSILGWVVYLLAFGLILVLSIIAGTLQSLRLQFVEFFGKFFTGGGRAYVPFGRRAA